METGIPNLEPVVVEELFNHIEPAFIAHFIHVDSHPLAAVLPETPERKEKRHQRYLRLGKSGCTWNALRKMAQAVDRESHQSDVIYKLLDLGTIQK